jgi:hypothetical protein
VQTRGNAAALLVATVSVASVVALALPTRTAPVADDGLRRLTDVARIYSGGFGRVRCPGLAAWGAGPASFGRAYANLRSDEIVLAPVTCEGARNVGTTDVPAWQQALGALVLVHEAFHVRRWRFRRDEGKVECQAIVYFKDAAERLGATTAEAEGLYAYALALHANEGRLFSSYRDPTCLVPPWAPPERW